MNFDEYLGQIEHSTMYMFDGLDYYRNLVKQIPHPIYISDTPFDDGSKWRSEIDKWLQDTEQEHRKAKQISERYFGLVLSQAILAGSIFQVAHSAIELFSSNSRIPSTCASFVKAGRNVVRFCIGREIRGLPLGLVIYGVRNQYAHWDDPTPHQITREIFGRLSTQHGYGDFVDPCFDLSNPRLDIYAHNVIALIGWNSFGIFMKEMRELLPI